MPENRPAFGLVLHRFKAGVTPASLKAAGWLKDLSVPKAVISFIFTTTLNCFQNVRMLITPLQRRWQNKINQGLSDLNA
jgi:hypothetical protein